MKNGRKHVLAVLLIVMLLALILSGCANDEPPVSSSDEVQTTTATDQIIEENGPVTLRVVIEESSDNTRSFINLVNYLKVFFEKNHENVELVIEEIPLLPKSREIALTQLRAEVMAGRGPDIYLLPTKEIQDKFYSAKGEAVESVFPDLNQAMRNGVFADISALYDADTDLRKETLVTGVMDAGVVDGARYVLPLRFNVPLAYVDMTRLEAAGLGADAFDSGMIGLMDALAARNVCVAEAASAGYITPMALNYLPDALDYDNQQLLLTKDDVVDFMNSYQAFKTVQSGKDVKKFVQYAEYILAGLHWAESDEYCMQIESVESIVHQLLIAKAAEIDLGVFPLTTKDGTLVADVSFYGAVGAGCEHPELAYDFIRQFLSESSQWEVSVRSKDINALMADGYPVRMLGSLELIRSNLMGVQVSTNSDVDVQERYHAVESVKLVDEDIRIIQESVNKAQFPIPPEESLSDILQHKITANTTAEEIDALADEWLKELEFHLYEG